MHKSGIELAALKVSREVSSHLVAVENIFT